MKTPFMLFTATPHPPQQEITPEYALVPFNQKEVELAKDQGYTFGHLFEEQSDEFLMNRKFTYVSSLIL